jgi:CubicO group peptidase (beta-lactamase class C family)
MGCSVGYVRTPPKEWSDGRAPQLEPLIRRHCAPFLKRGKSIGMAVAVVTPTNATIMTFGRPSLWSGARTSPDTLFELGSITKTFTGITLARAIERGAVRLDTRVQDLLPADVRLPGPATNITLRHLTTHTSGFPRMPEDRSLLPAFRMIFFGGDPYEGYDTPKLMADVRRVRLESAPGTKASYSNFAMMLLGQLLATKAGTTYEKLVKQEVCLPLGMSNTTVTVSSSQAPHAAQGYRAVYRCGPFLLALRSAPWFAHSELGGVGGIKSTATDMLKYLQANMHPDGLPIEHAIRLSHETLFDEDGSISYGMNWIHQKSAKRRPPLIWHNGGTGGFRSFIGFSDDSRAGVFVLSNTAVDVDPVAMAILRELDRRARPSESKSER